MGCEAQLTAKHELSWSINPVNEVRLIYVVFRLLPSSSSVGLGCMHDLKSICVAVMISATLVNTQAYRYTYW